jgi:hypothetical protein
VKVEKLAASARDHRELEVACLRRTPAPTVMAWR